MTKNFFLHTFVLSCALTVYTEGQYRGGQFRGGQFSPEAGKRPTTNLPSVFSIQRVRGLDICELYHRGRLVVGRLPASGLDCRTSSCLSYSLRTFDIIIMFCFHTGSRSLCCCLGMIKSSLSILLDALSPAPLPIATMYHPEF